MLARELKSVVKTISPALAGATLPICNCVNFDHERIWSTNLEATIAVGCDVSGVGASIPHKPLKALLSSIDPKDDVGLHSADGSLIVCSPAGETTLSGLAVEELPDTSLTGTIVSSAKIDDGLAESFRAVATAASKDQSRQILTGVFVEIADGTISLTATDSYRLHHDELTAASTDGVTEVVCPATYIKALPGKEPVTIDVTEGHVRLSEGSVTLTMKLIDGAFPNYRQLRPVSTPHQAVLGDRRSSLERTLKTLERLASRLGSSPPVSLDFSAGKSSVAVGLKLIDTGEHRCVLTLDDYVGDSLQIAFNPALLREAIAFGGMELAIADPLKPAVLTDSKDGRYALLMPVRWS
jgi:DNA polymerase III subunit beta